ncbi:MAG: hypothetical protein ACK2U2_19260, partial [Anaerolineae bacterium]
MDSVAAFTPESVADFSGIRIDDAQVAEEAALDGLYVIRTPLPTTQLSSDDAVRYYKDLGQV